VALHIGDVAVEEYAARFAQSHGCPFDFLAS
jgi:hypothetical protein